jgi:site-specific DNA recombinase
MRMHAGRIASAKNGTWISGASTPPFGYRYNQATKRLVIDDDEASVVRQLFQWLVAEKLSLYRIQMRLNDMKVPTKFDRMRRKKPSGSKCWWNKRTIGRILANEVYTGTFTFRKYARCGTIRKATNLRPKEDWLVAHCPPIISNDTFRKAQKQLRKNSENSPGRTKTLYLLSKLLICAHDNRRMQAATRPSEGSHRECRYYFCSGTRKQCSPVRCPSGSVSESRIVPPIWDKMRELLSDPATVLEELAKYQAQRTQSDALSRNRTLLEARLQKSATRLSRLIELYLSEAVDKQFFQTQQARLKEDVESSKRDLRKLSDSEITRDELLRRARSIQHLYASYNNKLISASDEVKREIFQTFIKAVIVRGEELDIEVILPPMQTTDSAPSCFAGQPPRWLPRKDELTLFLTAKLVPVAQIFQERCLHKNFGVNNGPRRRASG